MAKLPLFVRRPDWADGGWNAEESVQLSIPKRKGVDLIDVSSGALVPYQKIPVALITSAIC
jgi:hypothetical protein